ncbi:hypothetical protein ACFC6L_15990 [Kitasatospora phosalacinea]|uniref:hypothetical protein n=1 Tax=Kitasatospora phosalacinea TaxID=2065 RepID=UPI0035DA3D8B
MRSPFRVAAALSAAALAAVLVPVGAARADTVVLDCVASTSATYSPAITSTAQSVTVDATTSWTCTGLPTGYTSATSSDHYTTTLTCTDLLNFPAGSKTYTWNDSTTSTFSFTRVNTRVVNGTTVVELVGSITAGTFQGATVSSTAVALNTQLDACSTTGVSALDFTGDTVILGL